MAKRRRRSKAGPPNAPQGGAGASSSGLNGVEELRGELESLKAELSSAQAEASERRQAPPHRSRRGVAIAAGVVTAGAGVTAGLLVANQGSQSRVAAPVTAVPATRPIAPATRPRTSAAQPSAPATQPTTPVTQPARTAQPTAPSSLAPSTAVPPPAAGTGLGGLVVVERGQSFWSIAQAVEAQSLGRVPTTAEVTRYWLAVIAANTSRLPRRGDPNLLFVGQAILLPPM